MAAPKIFVSHSHKDDAFTGRLVEDLRLAGANAWMDNTDLGAGNFQQRISEALAGCEWFVLVLTRDALASPWVRQEVDAANRLKNQGQVRDLIFIQAGPLEHRQVPALWGVFNIFDATANYDSARDHALKAVGLPALIPSAPATQATFIAPERFPQRLADLGFVGKTEVIDGKLFEYIVPPLCDVPAGPFLMGYGQDTVILPAYQIARYPVTVAEYDCFVRIGKAAPRDWQWQLSRLDHPAVYVSWNDATAYTLWLSERAGQSWRLPNEQEWEKAARGPYGRIYPWGDTFDKTRCNTSESGTGGATPIGKYPSGVSPYGTQDQAGNVWEWTASHYGTAINNQMVRGGAWNSGANDALSTSSDGWTPKDVYGFIGFRLVVAAHPAE